MKAIVLIGDKVIGKAMANGTCIRSEGKLRFFFDATPSRTSENALLEGWISIAFLLDLFAEKGKLVS